ncbi:hypothetical protein GPALN_012519 [Globodera pallida]|nr:hypothetical protein GPALN_012519 [Globodera pallida]
MVQPKCFVYGTSGFRDNALLLGPVVRRTAFYAAIRARMLAKSVGVMITASHNPISDNGIKLVDPNGRMLPMDCETELTNIVNATEDEFERIRKEMMDKTGTGIIGGRPAVIIATDTRPSCPELLGIAVEEIARVDGVHVEKYENSTTPQLHFIVRSINREDTEVSRNSFLFRFRHALADSLKLIPLTNCTRYTKQLFVDCANGVGSLWVDKYLAAVDVHQSSATGHLTEASLVEPVQLNILNTDTGSLLLNDQCGADFVKIHVKLPANFDSCSAKYERGGGGGGGVVLLDGDHIAALFARFIAEQFSAAERLGQKIALTFGIVQTAYANGNSTRFFSENLGIDPIMTKTGVKHLEEAAQQFDVGLYFEANGHGTRNNVVPRHIELLSMFSQLVNEVIGDGIADMLAVECLLRYFDWTVQDWLAETYTDIPNVQKKIEVKDRSVFETAADRETLLVRPEGIQAKINEIVNEFDRARAFIRPSGTEPIVRVYAEAESVEQANELAERLAELSMAAQMFRIGKPKNGQQQQQQQQQQPKKEVRFELQIAEAEEANEPMVLGTVQERFSGFFELPERCVPFEAEPLDDAGFEQGFPAVFNLATASNFKPMSDSADSLGNKDGKANSKQKGSSLFAQHFHQIIREDGESPLLQAKKVVDKSVDETIKNLEPMLAGSCSPNAQNKYGSATNSVQSERYALDPVHSDLTVKCLQNVFSRQEQQLIKLFDTLACISSSTNTASPHLSTPESVRVLDEAKRNIAHIRPLYLEQFQSEESGRVSWRFARRLVDPFSDGAWTLSPIRRVLDAVQQRNPDIATSDDVEIVRLALLWTVLLLLERPAFFRASVNVSEFFCRLAELYLIGPEVFVYDQSIRSCVSILIDTFLVDACQKGLLTLRLNQPIAFLDKFAPFFEDLLQRFENFSSGDDNFALLLLIGVYLNASCADGLLMAQTLWSPKRDVVRQIILPEEKVSRLIPYIFAEKCARELGRADGGGEQEQLLEAELAKLIMNYAGALREDTVIESRNGAMHAFASEEVRQFTRWRNQTDGRDEQQRTLEGDLQNDDAEKC